MNKKQLDEIRARCEYWENSPSRQLVVIDYYNDVGSLLNALNEARWWDGKMLRRAEAAEKAAVAWKRSAKNNRLDKIEWRDRCYESARATSKYRTRAEKAERHAAKLTLASELALAWLLAFNDPSEVAYEYPYTCREIIEKLKDALDDDP